MLVYISRYLSTYKLCIFIHTYFTYSMIVFFWTISLLLTCESRPWRMVLPDMAFWPLYSGEWFPVSSSLRTPDKDAPWLNIVNPYKIYQDIHKMFLTFDSSDVVFPNMGAWCPCDSAGLGTRCRFVFCAVTFTCLRGMGHFTRSHSLPGC